MLYTQTKSGAGKLMLKSGILSLVMLMITSVAAIQANVNDSDNTLKLTARQYSIESFNDQRHVTLDDQETEGILSFRIHTGYKKLLDTHQLLSWIKKDSLLIKGIRFDTENADLLNNYRLDIPYKFENTLNEKYMETTLFIESNNKFDFISINLTIYRGMVSIIEIIKSEEDPVVGKMITSFYSVKADKFNGSTQSVMPSFSYVNVPVKKSDELQNPFFFFRNRYWLAGALTIAASSTTALILSGGESAVYLPKPPGRP